MSRRALKCPNYHHLEPKTNAKSPVWAYFGVPVNEDGSIVTINIVMCKICQKSVGSKGGSTSNLASHLKLHHPLKYKKLPCTSRSSVPPISGATTFFDVDSPPAPEETITHSANTASNLPPTKKQKHILDFQPLDEMSNERCTKSVTEFLATSMQPYNVVEHPDFKKMFNTLNPNYKLPGRKYFSKTAVPKLYNETVEKLKRALSGVNDSNISITTDCWTSVANSPFIDVTAHFISNEWKLMNACLNCRPFDLDHTADNITDIVTDIMSEWNIKLSDISCLTTDNSSNILKAAQDLHLPHLSCFAHNINIGVNRALEVKELKRAVSGLKCLQSSIAHSWKMKRDLHIAQADLKMDQVNLPSACPTTWWSTVKLCRIYLHNQLAIHNMLMSNKDKNHLMEEIDSCALEDFISATALIEDMTKTLCGSSYLTASSVLPLYAKIKTQLQNEDQDSPLLKKLKSEILAALSERYNSQAPMASILGLATLCDPRFRLRFLDDPEGVRQSAVDKIAELQMLHDLREDKTQIVQVQLQTPKTGLAKYLDFDDEGLDEPQPLSNKRAEKEITSYLAMPKVGYNDCPILWWKAHNSSFPYLGVLARKYLPIPGTSVPSERVFSMSGLVINKQRASLKPKDAEIQIFLAQNRSFIQIEDKLDS